MHAAIEFAEFHDLPRRWLVGWSFGSELVLMHGRDPAIEGAILLSPPLHRATDADLDAWADFGKPLLVLVPELDDYLRPDEARARFARVPQAEVIGVDGAKHLWVGESAPSAACSTRSSPASGPTSPCRCPTTWHGPATTARRRRAATTRAPDVAAPLAVHELRTGDPARTPLVLLPGFPLDGRMWAAVADALPPGDGS